VIAVTVINALVWLILGPIMARSLHSRTCQALDALLNNMAITGNTATQAEAIQDQLLCV
jgi:hypothetical protein